MLEFWVSSSYDYTGTRTALVLQPVLTHLFSGHSDRGNGETCLK